MSKYKAYGGRGMIDEKKPKIGEWIPCSERLPEEDGIYIVDDRRFDNPWVHTAGFVKTSQCWAECHGVYYDDKYCRYDDGSQVIRLRLRSKRQSHSEH